MTNCFESAHVDQKPIVFSHRMIVLNDGQPRSVKSARAIVFGDKLTLGPLAKLGSIGELNSQVKELYADAKFVPGRRGRRVCSQVFFFFFFVVHRREGQGRGQDHSGCCRLWSVHHPGSRKDPVWQPDRAPRWHPVPALYFQHGPVPEIVCVQQHSLYGLDRIQ
jgi:hypothetical protein